MNHAAAKRSERALWHIARSWRQKIVKLGKKRLATCDETADSPQLIRATPMRGACLFVWSNSLPIVTTAFSLRAGVAAGCARAWWGDADADAAATSKSSAAAR